MSDSKPNIPSKISQLELGIERTQERDRNYNMGGRSFYFFDFDDNIAFLSTPLVLFHKETGQELRITSGDFAQEHANIAQSGIYKDYEIRWDDHKGTFRCFRDHNNDELMRLGLKKQIFVHDIAEALGLHDFHWKGPSWSCFYHATFNQRPVSVITARGHHPETIKEGVRLFVDGGYLPMEPNYLSIFPVNHIPTRHLLGDTDLNHSTAVLKQKAIRASVEQAIAEYGVNPHHRFGMSDDDPKNIELIVEEMRRLKSKYPEMSFFMIETQKGEFIKHEIVHSGVESERISTGDSLVANQQMDLFSSLSKKSL